MAITSVQQALTWLLVREEGAKQKEKISSDRPRPAIGREPRSCSQKQMLRLGYRCKWLLLEMPWVGSGRDTWREWAERAGKVRPSMDTIPELPDAVGGSEYNWYLRISFTRVEEHGLSHSCTSSHWFGATSGWGEGGVRVGHELLSTHGSKYIQVKWLLINSLKKVADSIIGSEATHRSWSMVQRSDSWNLGDLEGALKALPQKRMP